VPAHASAQDEHTRQPRDAGFVGGQAVQDRQREGGRLAGAGLGDALQVLPSSTAGMAWAWIGVGVA
jgi:hypothetical protein